MNYEEIASIIERTLLDNSFHVIPTNDYEAVEDFDKELCLSVDVNLLMAKLSDEDKQLLEGYLNSIQVAKQYELNYAYLQGARDCATMFRKLKAFD